ncbi:MAG: hypothetical protein KDA80_06120 [Planctomycetaceae bacterium]|nr:hypothetical protein [Planctomycetaceae bacterium]
MLEQMPASKPPRTRQKNDDHGHEVEYQGVTLRPFRSGVEHDTIFLPLGTHCLGTGDSCEVQLSFPGIGDRHCTLVVGPRRIVVRAWSPLTWVNDGAVSEGSLRSGDRLILGPMQFLVEPVFDASSSEHNSPVDSRRPDEVVPESPLIGRNLIEREEFASEGADEAVNPLPDAEKQEHLPINRDGTPHDVRNPQAVGSDKAHASTDTFPATLIDDHAESKDGFESKSSSLLQGIGENRIEDGNEDGLVELASPEELSERINAMELSRNQAGQDACEEGNSRLPDHGCEVCEDTSIDDIERSFFEPERGIVELYRTSEATREDGQNGRSPSGNCDVPCELGPKSMSMVPHVLVREEQVRELITELQDSLDEFFKRERNHRREVSQFQTQMAARQRELETQSEALEFAQQHLQSEQTRLRVTSARQQAAETRLANLAQLKEGVEQRQRHMDRRETELAERAYQLARHNRTLREWDLRLKGLAAELDRKQLELSEREETVETRQRAAHAESRSASALQSELEIREQALTQQFQELLEQQQQLVTRQHDWEELRRTWESERQTLQAELDGQELEIARHREELQDWTVRLDGREEELRVRLESLEDLESVLKTEEEQLGELRDEVTFRQASLNELEDALAKRDQILEMRFEDLATRERELEEQRTHLCEAQSRYEEALNSEWVESNVDDRTNSDAEKLAEEREELERLTKALEQREQCLAEQTQSAEERFQALEQREAEIQDFESKLAEDRELVRQQQDLLIQERKEFEDCQQQLREGQRNLEVERERFEKNREAIVSDNPDSHFACEDNENEAKRVEEQREVLNRDKSEFSREKALFEQEVAAFHQQQAELELERKNTASCQEPVSNVGEVVCGDSSEEAELREQRIALADMEEKLSQKLEELEDLREQLDARQNELEDRALKLDERQETLVLLARQIRESHQTQSDQELERYSHPELTMDEYWPAQSEVSLSESSGMFRFENSRDSSVPSEHRFSLAGEMKDLQNDPAPASETVETDDALIHSEDESDGAEVSIADSQQPKGARSALDESEFGQRFEPEQDHEGVPSENNPRTQKSPNEDLPESDSQIDEYAISGHLADSNHFPSDSQEPREESLDEIEGRDPTANVRDETPSNSEPNLNEEDQIVSRLRNELASMFGMEHHSESDVAKESDSGPGTGHATFQNGGVDQPLSGFVESGDDEQPDEQHEMAYSESDFEEPEETQFGESAPAGPTVASMPLEFDDESPLDDSIAKYMERLLARSNGGSAETPRPPAPKPQKSIPEPAVAEPVPATAPSAILEEAPAKAKSARKLRPEERDAIRANMDSFREVANISARTAVAKSSAVRKMSAFRFTTIAMGVAWVTSLALAITELVMYTGIHLPTIVSAGLALLLSAVWTIKYQEIRHLRNTAKDPLSESGEMRISEPEDAETELVQDEEEEDRGGLTYF